MEATAKAIWYVNESHKPHPTYYRWDGRHCSWHSRRNEGKFFVDNCIQGDPTDVKRELDEALRMGALREVTEAEAFEALGPNL